LHEESEYEQYEGPLSILAQYHAAEDTAALATDATNAPSRPKIEPEAPIVDGTPIQFETTNPTTPRP